MRREDVEARRRVAVADIEAGCVVMAEGQSAEENAGSGRSRNRGQDNLDEAADEEEMVDDTLVERDPVPMDDGE